MIVTNHDHQAVAVPCPAPLHRTSRSPVGVLDGKEGLSAWEIYTDTGDPAQRDALSRLHGLLDEAQD